MVNWEALQSGAVKTPTMTEKTPTRAEKTLGSLDKVEHPEQDGKQPSPSPPSSYGAVPRMPPSEEKTPPISPLSLANDDARKMLLSDGAPFDQSEPARSMSEPVQQPSSNSNRPMLMDHELLAEYAKQIWYKDGNRVTIIGAENGKLELNPGEFVDRNQLTTSP